MRAILLTLLFCASNICAQECKQYIPPDGVSLSIEKDKDPSVGIVYVWAPLELEGSKIKSFIFSASREIDGEVAELVYCNE